MSIKDGKLLYHLTSLDNLENIFKYGLLSRSAMDILGFEFKDVADQEIIDFRRDNGLNDYVPFHFFAKNPFDGRVQIDNEGMRFAYIIVHRNFARDNNFRIIPRHPKNMRPLSLFSYEEGLDNIDWATMDKKQWSKSSQDNYECKEVCMAECISPMGINARNFQSIAVKNKYDEEYVRSLLNKYNLNGCFHVDISVYYFL